MLGAPPPESLGRLRELGYPPDATVGTSGLERVFETKLAGTPGGQLRAGTRVLALTLPKPGQPVHSSIDPAVQRAAVAAKGERLGGVAVVRPRTGEILALAGLAFSGLQPPGSTFKIITLTGVLEANLAGPGSTYPVETKTTIEGVDLENANGESCGGTLRSSFAHSCNSVFAPLGAKLGADEARADGRAVRVQRRTRGSRAPRRARSRQRARSATTSRSPRRRSVRAASRRPRCRWPGSRRRSPGAAGARG